MIRGMREEISDRMNIFLNEEHEYWNKLTRKVLIEKRKPRYSSIVFISPGVYVIERDITIVPTSTFVLPSMIIGCSSRGLSEPVIYNSIADFE